MKKWLTYREAATICGRSKRTIRRWAGDSANEIRTTRSADGETLVHSGDVVRTERLKSAYRDTPTFGRVRF